MKPGPRYFMTGPRLGPRSRRTVYGLGLLLLGSGAAWLLMHHFVRVAGEFGPEHHPLESWLMRLHGLLALPALVGVGALLPAHVLPAWRPRQRRPSGLALLIACTALALGGWALYYVADDAVRGWVSVSHWVLGLSLPAVLLVHIIGARRARRAQDRAAARMPGV